MYRNTCFDINTGEIILEEHICNGIEQLSDLVYKSIDNCNGALKTNNIRNTQ